MSDFEESFEKLMARIAEEALEAEHLADKVDAAKVLQPYYALRRKHRLPPAEPGTMDDLRKRIRAVENRDDADAA